ncbi:MAG: energy-coupling factor ABC transporter permease, partial [Gammaproteobacteria bacterium]|nr:energy-coupling factor ABC transporter permease [Gammaproteobacteria bacterium]
MDFPEQVFTGTLHALAAPIALIWLLGALLRLPVRRLYDNAFTHVYFGACVAVLLLWSLHAGVPPTLHFHLLGVTALTLMFGWQFASLGVALILMGATLNGQGGWSTFAVNMLCMGGIPIAVSSLLLRWAQRRLPHNFFIYVYVNAFLASGVSIVATGFAGAGLLWFTGTHSLEWLSYQYLAFFPLMFFSEAVMNGMVMTLLVALRPDWVCSFDDE